MVIAQHKSGYKTEFVQPGVHYATKKQEGAVHGPFKLALQSTWLDCDHRALTPSLPSPK